MKICILAAGRGTRMGAIGEGVHKSLLPLENKAIITHIIEQFPEDSEFVIALGYKQEQVMDYLSIAHPNLSVSFVTVENFDGPGSGPGLSLYSCKDKLQCPFLFTACDTLITTKLPQEKCNWVGTQTVNDIQKWCSVKVTDRNVTNIYYKVDAPTDQAFTGIAFIHDTEQFWRGFDQNNSLLGNELQVNNGLNALISNGLKAFHIGWEDTGNEQNYRNLLKKYKKNYSFEGKTTDITYRIKNTVIKFFKDPSVAQRRFYRATKLLNVFPNVIDNIGNFYSYSFTEGPLLSKNLNHITCKRLLDWAQKGLWSDVTIDPKTFKKEMKSFYFNKTKMRLDLYCKKYLPNQQECDCSINDIAVPTTIKMITNLPEKFYSNGIPSTYHGDFHSDNIICQGDENFALIDWRDSFGSLTDEGDRYYDLAKFLHTLELSVLTMEKGWYKVKKTKSGIYIDHRCRYNDLDAFEAFWDFVSTQQYDITQIRIINALIYTNMAPLYDRDMADYLYYFGRYSLHKALLRQ